MSLNRHMTSSLVLELQSAALDPAKPVDSLLRMALVVATKLKLAELRSWCEQELGGYAQEGVPTYRRVRGEVKAHNPYRGWIPVMFANAPLHEQLSQREVGSPISELEHLLSQKSDGTLHMAFSQSTLLEVFGDSEAFQLGMVPTLIIGRSEVHGILAAVRDRVLNWSLRLEQEGILGDGMTFSAKEVSKASSITYNIGTFTGVLGDVSGSNVHVVDYSSVHAGLKKAGIQQADRNALA